MKKFAMLALVLSFGLFAAACDKKAEPKKTDAPKMEGTAPAESAAAPAEGAAAPAETPAETK